MRCLQALHTKLASCIILARRWPVSWALLTDVVQLEGFSLATAPQRSTQFTGWVIVHNSKINWPRTLRVRG